METTKSAIKVAAWVLAIPIVAFIVALLVLGYITEGAPSGVDIGAVCRQAGLDPELRSFCNDFSLVTLLRNTAIVAAALPLTILLLTLAGAIAAGRSRPRMAAVFPPLTVITIIGLAVTVVIQACVFMGAIYFGEAALIQRIHVGVIGGIGLAAAFAAWNLIQSTLSMMRPPELHATGALVDRTSAPRLFEHVEGIAQRLGASPPRQIILGIEPNFYVTSARVRLFGRADSLRGETLYLSLPLARLLTPAELTAIVGHELGHFRGGDTEYSLKFAPVYRGLGDAINAIIAQNSERQALTSLPVQAMLSFLYNVFAHNEAAVGRERELEADKAGAESASALDVATSLLKCGVYGQLWPRIDQEATALANTGVHVRNFGSHLADAARLDLEPGSSEKILDIMMGFETKHPIDTHPPTGERLTALGVSRQQVSALEFTLPPKTSASTLIDDFAAHELTATRQYQAQGVAFGVHGDGGTHILAKNAPLAGHQAIAAILRSASPLSDAQLRAVDDECDSFLDGEYFRIVVREMIAAEAHETDLAATLQAAVLGLPAERRSGYAEFLGTVGDIAGVDATTMQQARLALASLDQPQSELEPEPV